MPKRRLLPTLAVLAATVAACFGSPPASPSGAPPSVEVALKPSATSSPDPTRTPAPTVTAIPVATTSAVSCLSLDQADLSDLEVELGNVDASGSGGTGSIWPGRVGGTFDVTRITELTGSKRSITPPPSEDQPQRGLLLGGLDFVTFPEAWFDGSVNPQQMITADVALTLDGQAPIDLPTRFVPGNENFDQFAATVPDVAGRGVLSMDLVWADPCFRYQASAAIPVDVVPLSATAGCALGRDTYLDQVAAVLDGSLRAGSTPVHAFSPSNEAKFLSWGNPGIDAIALYAFNPDDPAITAAPGVALTIEQVSTDITVGNDMTLDVYTRASVARAIKDYPPDGEVLVLTRTPVKQSDGTFRLRVPQDPGRYVAVVGLTYDSQCSSGTLWFVVNIDVVAPAPTATASLAP